METGLNKPMYNNKKKEIEYIRWQKKKDQKRYLIVTITHDKIYKNSQFSMV